MRFSHVAKAIFIFVLSVVAVASSWADKIPVRGGSTYGDDQGLAGCQAKIAAFLSDPNNLDNCEGFETTTFTIRVTNQGSTIAIQDLVIKAITIYVAIATMIVNLLADLMYKAVDPRVQLK